VRAGASFFTRMRTRVRPISPPSITEHGPFAAPRAAYLPPWQGAEER
jgi:hypothetical protein